MESIWERTCAIPERETFQGEARTQVAVIGAGMTGVLTALLCREKGLDAVVLEAGRIAGGVTRNTTAKITAQHGLIYDRLITQAGEEKARQYLLANQRAVEKYRSLIETRGIDCDFEEKSAFVYSLDDTAGVGAEVRAAKRLGMDARMTTKAPLPFPILGAAEFPRQAQFHPLKFLRAVSQELTIYEHSQVCAIENGVLLTDAGRLHAEQIVMAAHYPFLNAPGFYFMRMHQERSYVLALENAAQVEGMYIDANADGFSLRNAGPLLLFGGAGHRTGKNPQGGCYEQLRQAARSLYPESREVAAWSAQDCMPADGIPYIGSYGGSTPHFYVATGFQKWGMSSAMAAAMILSDAVMGVQNDCAAVFSPQRLHLAASAKNLAADSKEAISGLVTQKLAVPDEYVEQLPKGHGGVMEYENQKVGVYKDQDGQVFLVSTKCPHLGCQLEWNPDELSWDCPCHGSRFDFHGALLNDPAQSGISLAGQI